MTLTRKLQIEGALLGEDSSELFRLAEEEQEEREKHYQERGLEKLWIRQSLPRDGEAYFCAGRITLGAPNSDGDDYHGGGDYTLSDNHS